MNPKKREKMIVSEPIGNARPAVTQYEVARRFDGFTAVRLFPKTGRTHQLRVHMQHLGHSIVADRLVRGRIVFDGLGSRLDSQAAAADAADGRRDAFDRPAGTPCFSPCLSSPAEWKARRV